MPSIKRVVTVTKPVDRVFAYLSDFTTTEEWDPGTVSTVRVSGDGDVGTVYRNVSRFAGREVTTDYRVEHLVPGRLFQVRGEHDSAVATDTVTFAEVETAEGPGTEVTYLAELAFTGLRRYAAPLLAPAFGRLGDEAERGLREALARL